MRTVKVFEIRGGVNKVNAFLSKIQAAGTDNRIISIQFVGKLAYVTAAVEFRP